MAGPGSPNGRGSRLKIWQVQVRDLSRVPHHMLKGPCLVEQTDYLDATNEPKPTQHQIAQECSLTNLTDLLQVNFR